MVAVVDRRLVVLAGGAFVVAGDGTLVVGLLRLMARSLSVSTAAAGQAVTVFAIVYALGSPLLVRAARRISSRALLTGTLMVLGLANAASAAAPSLSTLLGARALAAACAGTFMPVAGVVAASSARAQSRGRALAVLVGGASAGTALGVPLGTWVGALFSWRIAFALVAVAAAALAVATVAVLPRRAAPAMPARSRGHGPVTLTLISTLLWATGSFTFFTYVAVILHAAASVDAEGVAGFLLMFGVAGIGGSAAAGWITDHRGARTALFAALALTSVALAGQGLAAHVRGGIGPPLSILAIALYGIGTWAVTPPQQQRLIHSGRDPRLLLSLNASALYAGVAIGSGIGGLTLNLSHNPTALCLLAAAIEILALTFAAATSRVQYNR